MVKIHTESKKPAIKGALFIIFAVTVFTLIFKESAKQIIISGTIIFVISIAFVIRFFRVPTRIVNLLDTGIISPADGTVLFIEDVFEDEYFHDVKKKISIFMSVNNVHINYHPASGNIEYYKYHPGKYYIAWLPKASELNEHNTVVIKRKDDKEILYRQIAGFVARRIVCKLKEGDSAIQGEEMGLIKFGSRVDVFLPIEAEINVNAGSKVIAKKSILAYL